MRYDRYGTITMEQCGWPGNIGDAAAETSRVDILSKFVGVSVNPDSLKMFVTNNGVLRHPDAPVPPAVKTSWREIDTPSDQYMPLLIASDMCGLKGLAYRVYNDMIGRGYKTSNGQLVSPMLLATIKRFEMNNGKDHWMWFWDRSFLYQSYIFKIPYRWSDEKKWFEKSDGSSADYLNWLMGIIYAYNEHSWTMNRALKNVKKEFLIEKIKAYYAKEPNSQWAIDLYLKAVDKVYG